MKMLLLFPFLMLACAGSFSEKTPTMPKGYTYDDVREVELENELEEISGLEYDGNGSFYAHNDEEGVIYRMDGEYKITTGLAFAEDGDYEEIRKIGNTLYVLNSKGDIWSVDYQGDQVTTAEEFEWPGDKAEFESMFYDEQAGRLVLICKKEKGDKDSRTTRGFAFYPGENRFDQTAVFSLSWDDAAKVAGFDVETLRPSSAAIHPLSGELYLLASKQRLLLVLDKQGGVKQVHPLDKDRFPQAEGITFDSEANLYISNEAADRSDATLLRFAYQAG